MIKCVFLIFFALIAILLLFASVRDLISYLYWRIKNQKKRQQGSVDVGDCQIYYEIIGQGEPLLLLHGGLTSLHIWYRLLPRLARRYKIIRIDFRGHGKSQRGSKPLSYKQYADDVIKILDKINVSAISVAGWSDGGNVALMLGIFYPSHTKKIIAISANIDPSGLILKRQKEQKTTSASKAPFWARLIHPNLKSDHGARKLWDHVSTMWKTRPKLTPSDLLKINAPTLLIRGEFDDISLTHSEMIQSTIPRAQLVCIPAKGHYLLQQAPDKITDLMLSFMQEN